VKSNIADEDAQPDRVRSFSFCRIRNGSGIQGILNSTVKLGKM
jgi:hypothetical protein